jgi:hypothetical protein
MMNVLKRLACRSRDFLITPLLQKNLTIQYPDAAVQLQLKLTYRALAESGRPLPDIFTDRRRRYFTLHFLHTWSCK